MGETSRIGGRHGRIVGLDERSRPRAPWHDRVDALVVVLDAAERIVGFNHACEMLTGLSASDVFGKPLRAMMVASGAPRALEGLLAVASGSSPAQQDSVWTDRDGARRQVVWTSSLLRILDGAVTQIVCVGSESRRAEEDELAVGSWEPPSGDDSDPLARLQAARAGALAHPQVGAAMRWIDRHFREPVSLRDVAAAVGYSPAFLTDQCRRATGHAVQAWIVGLRLLESRRLLLSTALSVEAVAAAVGYTEVRHFTRQFRRVHGQPPAAWRSGQQSGSLARGSALCQTPEPAAVR